MKKTNSLPVVILAIFLFVTVGTFGADKPGTDTPDIFKVSYWDYVKSGSNDGEFKVLSSEWVDAAKAELDKISAMVESYLEPFEPQQKLFREAHQAYLKFVKAYSDFAEDLSWLNLETGKYNYGSGSGYAATKIQAEAFWAQILGYHIFLLSGQVIAFRAGPLFVLSTQQLSLADIFKEQPKESTEQLKKSMREADNRVLKNYDAIRNRLAKRKRALALFKKAHARFEFFTRKYAELFNDNGLSARIILLTKQNRVYENFLKNPNDEYTFTEFSIFTPAKNSAGKSYPLGGVTLPPLPERVKAMVR